MSATTVKWVSGFLAVGGIGCVVLVVYLRGRPPMAGIPPKGDARSIRKEVSKVGGVLRSTGELRSLRLPRPVPGVNNPARKFSYGITPDIKSNTNSQVATVAEAVRTQQYAERLSLVVRPKPFDEKAFQVDPKSYLETIEPGRIWQSAQPGPNVRPIEAVSRYRQKAEQGLPVPLAVKVPPHAPVTFTSLDLGAFENELNSITVQADADGVAKTRFVGTPGTINNVNILAASPLASGQLRFVVHVEFPRKATLQ